MDDKTSYYQKTGTTILHRTKKYYKNNQERLREQARNKYRELSEEEKYIKRGYGRNGYHNMSNKKKKETKRIPKKLS